MEVRENTLAFLALEPGMAIVFWGNINLSLWLALLANRGEPNG